MPKVEAAIVPTSKVRDYLLDHGHADGGGKAKFFFHFGFNRDRWEELAEALRQHARENPVSEVRQDAAGVSYIIEGVILTPSGRRPKLRTIWLVEATGLAPRFITAYPLEHDR